MRVNDLIQEGCFKLLNGGEDLNREITSPYCCDLLSVAMGRLPAGAAWVTVMGNVNTLAVAALTDASCIILAEGSLLDEAALRKAEEQGVTVFQTEAPVFTSALTIHKLLNA